MALWTCFKETVERLNCPQNILKDGDLTDTIFGDEVQNVSITMDILTSLRTLSESHCDTLKKNTIWQSLTLLMSYDASMKYMIRCVNYILTLLTAAMFLAPSNPSPTTVSIWRPNRSISSVINLYNWAPSVFSVWINPREHSRLWNHCRYNWLQDWSVHVLCLIWNDSYTISPVLSLFIS